MSLSPVTIETPSFWSRQFASRRTRRQVGFDICFGIALPPLCLYLDPIVFKAGFGGPFLAGYAIAAYITIGIGILALSAWLAVGKLPALFLGLLTGGMVFSLLLGVLLFPFSLGGLVMLIGVLGFTPLITSFVFWRNAARALSTARLKEPRLRIFVQFLLGFVLIWSGPWLVQNHIKREVTLAIDACLSADPGQFTEAVTSLKRWRLLPLSEFDRIVFAFGEEEEPIRRERLAGAYEEITGEDIEARLRRLRD